MIQTDVQKEKSLLSKLKSRIATTIVSGKIVFVPRDKNRFACHNCRMKTVISMHNMDEFTCDGCGTVYKKSDQYS